MVHFYRSAILALYLFELLATFGLLALDFPKAKQLLEARSPQAPKQTELHFRPTILNYAESSYSRCAAQT
jgi:hypothetical protein